MSKPESNESCKAPLLKLWNEIRVCQSVRHRREALTRQREVDNMYADRQVEPDTGMESAEPDRLEEVFWYLEWSFVLLVQRRPRTKVF